MQWAEWVEITSTVIVAGVPQLVCQLQRLLTLGKRYVFARPHINFRAKVKHQCLKTRGILVDMKPLYLTRNYYKCFSKSSSCC